MKNPDIFICEIIETRMNEIIDKISRTDYIFEADPLDSELRILDWILFRVCSNKIKRFKKDVVEDSKVTNLVLSLYKSQEHLIPNFSAFSSILIEVSCISFKRI